MASKTEVTELPETHIERLMAKVAIDLVDAGIEKSGFNVDGGWAFRSIDAVYNTLGPILAANGVNIRPQVEAREATVRQVLQWNPQGQKVPVNEFAVCVRVRYEFVSSRDGTTASATFYGEGQDRGDKGTAKAMSDAYKQMVFQTWSVPVKEWDAPPEAKKPNGQQSTNQPDKDYDAHDETIKEKPEQPQTPESENHPYTLEELAAFGVRIDESEQDDNRLRELAGELFANKDRFSDKALKEFGSRLVTLRCDNVAAAALQKYEIMCNTFAQAEIIPQKQAETCIRLAKSRLNVAAPQKA